MLIIGGRRRMPTIEFALEIAVEDGCFFTNRFETTWLIADSAKLEDIGSPF